MVLKKDGHGTRLGGWANEDMVGVVWYDLMWWCACINAWWYTGVIYVFVRDCFRVGSAFFLLVCLLFNSKLSSSFEGRLKC